jgi:hypothetical protein
MFPTVRAALFFTPDEEVGRELAATSDGGGIWSIQPLPTDTSVAQPRVVRERLRLLGGRRPAGQGRLPRWPTRHGSSDARPRPEHLRQGCMTEMRDDLRELGRRLWPDDSRLHARATARPHAGRWVTPRRLGCVAMTVATAAVMDGALGAAVVLPIATGEGHPGWRRAPTAAARGSRPLCTWSTGPPAGRGERPSSRAVMTAPPRSSMSRPQELTAPIG